MLPALLGERAQCGAQAVPAIACAAKNSKSRAPPKSPVDRRERTVNATQSLLIANLSHPPGYLCAGWFNCCSVLVSPTTVLPHADESLRKEADVNNSDKTRI